MAQRRNHSSPIYLTSKSSYSTITPAATRKMVERSPVWAFTKLAALLAELEEAAAAEEAEEADAAALPSVLIVSIYFIHESSLNVPEDFDASLAEVIEAHASTNVVLEVNASNLVWAVVA